MILGRRRRSHTRPPAHMPTEVTFEVKLQDGQTPEDVVRFLERELKDDSSPFRQSFPIINLEYGVRLVHRSSPLWDPNSRAAAWGAIGLLAVVAVAVCCARTPHRRQTR